MQLNTEGFLFPGQGMLITDTYPLTKKEGHYVLNVTPRIEQNADPSIRMVSYLPADSVNRKSHAKSKEVNVR